MTSNKAGQRRGVFVSFEGGEGAGKNDPYSFFWQKRLKRVDLKWALTRAGWNRYRR